MDKNLKLFMVSHLGPNPCWRMVIADNPEEAFLQCAHDGRDNTLAKSGSCKIEEIQFDGYEIEIKKKDSS